MSPHHSHDAQLRRLCQAKCGTAPFSSPLGPEVVAFFKHSVQRRHTRLAVIAQRWQQLVPPLLAQHTALESYARGSLTVLVDSSSHLYDLKHRLLAGLEKQLLLACKTAGLRRITLKPGRWYAGANPPDRKPLFP